jgi:polar amino acid transport system ATP-binding protein
MIHVDAVTKRFGARTVLDGVSACFERGKVVSLIGPSGGGKSTLLRCLNGLESFDEGSIRVAGQALAPGGERANRKTLPLVRQRVGFVFQQWNLFAHRTALGNVVEAPVHVKKTPLREATERARAMLSRVGLSHREDAYPAEMSGGEQQRVAIARALAMEPEVLLLDEPTSALDPERVGDVLDLLLRVADDGLTMVIVTHEMAFARAISQRIVVLHGGRIIEDGPPAAVLDAPTHERTRAFLGLAREGQARSGPVSAHR